MRQFWRVNIYEVQAILYWILGVFIIHQEGAWHWVGWLSIGYGWLTFFSIIVLVVRNRRELKEAFE